MVYIESILSRNIHIELLANPKNTDAQGWGKMSHPLSGLLHI